MGNRESEKADPAFPISDSPLPIPSDVAGAEGFEPTNAGIKTRCLNHLATPLEKLSWNRKPGAGSRSEARNRRF